MNDPIVGLIPAAGKGTRLNLPYPKELYPVIRNNHYKPLAQFVVENLTASGVQEIVFVINETKHQLIGYFGSGKRFNVHFSYVVQENTAHLNGSTSPGLAHALDSAYHLVQGKTVLFGMADTIIFPRDAFSQLIDCAEEADDVVLGLFPVKRPEKSGMVELDPFGMVRQIIDKPAHTDLRFGWACILWRPAFTEHLHDCVDREHMTDFANIMNLAIAKGMKFRGVLIEGGEYSDLGTYDEISELDLLHKG